MGYTFKDPLLLLEACTHNSWKDGSPSYQRLEFLGDAVLDLLVTLDLIEKHPCALPLPLFMLSHFPRSITPNPTLEFHNGTSIDLDTGWVRI